MLGKDKLVWVRGVTIKTTRNSIAIKALDKTERTRIATVPSQYVTATQKVPGAEEWRYQLPQWLAFRNKLTWEEV